MAKKRKKRVVSRKSDDVSRRTVLTVLVIVLLVSLVSLIATFNALNTVPDKIVISGPSTVQAQVGLEILGGEQDPVTDSATAQVGLEILGGDDTVMEESAEASEEA
jgi:hypothetical protein